MPLASDVFAGVADGRPQVGHLKGSTNMVSLKTITVPTVQDAKTATLADVTITMADVLPLLPVEPSCRPADALSVSHSQTSAVRGEPIVPTAEGAGQRAFPPLTTQAANLFQSAVAFVGDGLALVDDAEFRRRLDVCRTCELRAGKRCTACGCWIGMKARGRAFQCPLNRWQGQNGVSEVRTRD
jgi:hypothetical protein